MTKHPKIIICEPSPVISEGLESIIRRCNSTISVFRVSQSDDLLPAMVKWSPAIAIINPRFSESNGKLLQALKSQFEDTCWIGLVYSYFSNQTLASFDRLITIHDTEEAISSALADHLDSSAREKSISRNTLTEREIEVLRLLATGLSNKKIADSLNISINTVITHRKNITQKTGIRSVSGLTIYAVIKNIITLS